MNKLKDKAAAYDKVNSVRETSSKKGVTLTITYVSGKVEKIFRTHREVAHEARCD